MVDEENCELVIGWTYAYAGPIVDYSQRCITTGHVMWVGGFPLVLLHLLVEVPGLGLTYPFSLLLTLVAWGYFWT